MTIELVIPSFGKRPEIFDAMVTAMFEEARAVQHDIQLPTRLAGQVYSMDPELPAEVIDAVFKDAGGLSYWASRGSCSRKELLVHEGLTCARSSSLILRRCHPSRGLHNAST